MNEAAGRLKSEAVPRLFDKSYQSKTHLVFLDHLVKSCCCLNLRLDWTFFVCVMYSTYVHIIHLEVSLYFLPSLGWAWQTTMFCGGYSSGPKFLIPQSISVLSHPAYQPHPPSIFTPYPPSIFTPYPPSTSTPPSQHIYPTLPAYLPPTLPAYLPPILQAYLPPTLPAYLPHPYGAYPRPAQPAYLLLPAQHIYPPPIATTPTQHILPTHGAYPRSHPTHPAYIYFIPLCISTPPKLAYITAYF